MDWCSHLGSVRMRPSLEVDNTIGVTRARFCVFFHRPLLGHCRRLVGVLTQLHVRVLGGQAGCEANVLPDQPPTAAPDKNRISLNWLSNDRVFKLSSYKALTCWSADQLKRGKWGTRDNSSFVQKKKKGGGHNFWMLQYCVKMLPPWFCSILNLRRLTLFNFLYR